MVSISVFASLGSFDTSTQEWDSKLSSKYLRYIYYLLKKKHSLSLSVLISSSVYTTVLKIQQKYRIKPRL